MGLLYTIGIRLVNFIVFFLVIVLMPGLPPKTTFKFEAFKLVFQATITFQQIYIFVSVRKTGVGVSILIFTFTIKKYSEDGRKEIEA